MWKSVKDELPKLCEPRYEGGEQESEYVLVFTKGTPNIAKLMYWGEELPQWYTDGEGWNITEYVTHWMPLPEAP